jgi:AcrR family transcriptional regulator
MILRLAMEPSDPDRPARRSVREESRELFRREIVRAATTVFGKVGYHRARMADIAAEAGVAAGTLYNYFDSKDAIFQYILRREAEELGGLLGRAAVIEPPLARLGAVIDTLLGFLEDRGALLAMYWQQGGDEFFQRTGTPDIEAEITSSVRDLLWAAMRDAASTGDLRPEVDIDIAMAMLEGGMTSVIGTWTTAGCTPGLAAKAEKIHDIFLRGATSR